MGIVDAGEVYPLRHLQQQLEVLEGALVPSELSRSFAGGVPLIPLAKHQRVRLALLCSLINGPAERLNHLGVKLSAGTSP